MENFISFNIDKTHMVCFHLSKSFHFSIDTAIGTISSKSHFKYLGVTFDCHLKFLIHVQKVYDSTNKLFFSLKRVAFFKFNIPSSSFGTIFKGAILPKLLHGFPAWCSVLEHPTYLKPLHKAISQQSYMSTQVIKEVKGTNDYTLMGQQLDLLTKNIVAHKNYVQYTTMVHSKVWIINTMIKTKKK